MCKKAYSEYCNTQYVTFHNIASTVKSKTNRKKQNS